MRSSWPSSTTCGRWARPRLRYVERHGEWVQTLAEQRAVGDLCRGHLRTSRIGPKACAALRSREGIACTSLIGTSLRVEHGKRSRRPRQSPELDLIDFELRRAAFARIDRRTSFGAQNPAILVLLFDCGVRREELCPVKEI